MVARVFSLLLFIWFTICLLVGVVAMTFAFAIGTSALLDNGEGWTFLALLLVSAILGTISYGMLVFLAFYWNRLRRRGQMSRVPERIARVLMKIMEKVMDAV